MEDRRKPNGDTARQKKLMSNLNPFSIQELLPTPCAEDGKNSTLPPSQEKRCSLIAKVMQEYLLPTPMSTDIHHGKRVKELKAAGGDTFHSRANGETRPNGLTDFLDFNDLLATPTARDWKGAQGRAYKGEGMDLPAQVCQPTDGATSQLNPLFVQEMMGFPEDWLVSPFLGGGQNP